MGHASFTNMKIRCGTQVVVLCAMTALCGCASLVDERRAGVMRERADTERIETDLSQLKERVEALATAQQELYKQIDAFRQGPKGDEGRLVELERNVRSLQSSQQALRQEIVDSLSKRMADVMRSSQPASSGKGLERGVEHVVKSGETLSAIAAAYKVSANVIVKANNLSSPNSIRVGQKLFIPE